MILPVKLPVLVTVSVEAVLAVLVTADPVRVVMLRSVSSRLFRSNVPDIALTSYLTWSAARSRTVAPAETESMKPFWFPLALLSSSRPPETIQLVVSGLKTVPVKMTWPALEVSVP